MMATSAVSQSSLFLHHHLPRRSNFRFHSKIISSTNPRSLFTGVDFQSSFISIPSQRPGLVSLTALVSKSPDAIVEASAEAVGEEAFIQVDSTGGGGGNRGDGGKGGGGGGGGGGGDNNNNTEGEDGSDDKKIGMSMSQKLTLGYAALVGLGGVIGYIKSGSQKSLLAGGLSAALLYYVYSQLPANPTFASAIGLGISAALLVVMGSRFKKSGKIFPAGVVSLVSFVMTGGYVHGIMRGMH